MTDIHINCLSWKSWCTNRNIDIYQDWLKKCATIKQQGGLTSHIEVRLSLLNIVNALPSVSFRSYVIYDIVIGSLIGVTQQLTGTCQRFHTLCPFYMPLRTFVPAVITHTDLTAACWGPFKINLFFSIWVLTWRPSDLNDKNKWQEGHNYNPRHGVPVLKMKWYIALNETNWQ